MPEQILIMQKNNLYNVYAGFPEYYPGFGDKRGSRTGRLNYYGFGENTPTNELKVVTEVIQSAGYQSLPVVLKTVYEVEQSFEDLSSFKLHKEPENARIHE